MTTWTDPGRHGDFADRRAAIEDAKIARCTCGAWTYGDHPCGACGRVPDARSAAS